MSNHDKFLCKLSNFLQTVEFQCELDLDGIGEAARIAAQDVFDSLQPIQERIAMKIEPLGGQGQIEIRGKKASGAFPSIRDVSREGRSLPG